MAMFTLSCSLTQGSNNGINHIIVFTKSWRCSHCRAHLLREVVIAGRVVVLILRLGAGDVDVDVVGLQHGWHGRDAGPLLQALDVEAFGKAQLVPLAVLPAQTLLRHARVLEFQSHRACKVHSEDVSELLSV